MATLDRSTLYKQIWSIPASQLALQYGISDVGLAKVCRRHRIPRPPRGYWARVHSGQRPPRTPLPRITDHRLDQVQIRGANMVNTESQGATASRNQPRERIVVPESLDDLHPLVAAAGRQLEGAKPDATGVVTSDARMAVAVSVRPETVERALRVWHALATAWEREGGTLSTAEGDSGSTVLAVEPDRVSIRMMETTEPLRRGRGVGTKATAPRLGFVLGDGALSGIKSTWADTTTVRLEKMLRPLVDSVTEYLRAQRQVRLDGECEKRQQERALAVRRAKANEVKEDFYLRHQLLQDVDRWERARNLRAYLHALRQRIEAGELAPRDPAAFSCWLEWAEWFADDMDPLCHPPPREKPPAGPTNTPVQELDVTSRTRSVVTQLGVKDSDELLLVPEARVKEIAGWSSGAWRELTLVLEGLGYDVSKRKTSYLW